jgi:hypothetical protein
MNMRGRQRFFPKFHEAEQGGVSDKYSSTVESPLKGLKDSLACL